MSRAVTVNVHVDFTELGRVRSELQTLLAQMSSVGGPPRGAGADQLGDASATDAVNAFVDQWARECRGLEDHLRDCLAVVSAALDEYTKTELLLAGQEVKK